MVKKKTFMATESGPVFSLVFPKTDFFPFPTSSVTLDVAFAAVQLMRLK